MDEMPGTGARLGRGEEQPERGSCWSRHDSGGDAGRTGLEGHRWAPRGDQGLSTGPYGWGPDRRGGTAGLAEAEGNVCGQVQTEPSLLCLRMSFWEGPFFSPHPAQFNMFRESTIYHQGQSLLRVMESKHR